MKHLKTYVNVTFKYPIYISGPDKLEDNEDFYSIIEDSDDGPNGYGFASDDVENVVKSTIPFAEDVLVDMAGCCDEFVDIVPSGSIVYDLAELTSEKSVSKYVVEQEMNNLIEAIQGAAFGGSVDEILGLADQLRTFIDTARL